MSDLNFNLQSGCYKLPVAVNQPEISLKELREQAVKFIQDKYPQHGYGDQLAEHLLLYRHDARAVNILQLVNTASEIADGALVEVVVSPIARSDRILVHPHTLFIHSYKSPTFCDFCGEMLFGLVKQGLKCQGCGLNYHKRCASRIPNNCSGTKGTAGAYRPPAAIPLTPKGSLNIAAAPKSGLMRLLSNSKEKFAAAADSALHSVSAPKPSPSVSQLGTPDICVTQVESDTDMLTSTGSSLLGAPLPRKDRSSSWSGRPLWMELEDARRIKVPHTFQVHSYTKPTVCMHCKKLLKGLIRQGLQCRDCKYNCHKKCSQEIPADCPGNANVLAQSPSLVPGTDGRESGLGSELGGSSTDLSMMGDAESDEGGEERPRPEPGEAAEDLDASQNIPLQRIVMSKKQTKRPSKVLMEGWVVHYTSRSSMKKKHYWRLDTKSITLYNDDSSNRYYKEIPLSSILHMRPMHATGARTMSHEFELKTAETTYYVALPPTMGENDPHTEQWEGAIRQALMPVTPQCSNTTGPGLTSLKVPVPGETGHLGIEMHSEQDFSQRYQINPDEVLGSGQFGTVYGGVHRQTGKDVAVKVIDKLKFPSKQEAALRVEVDILQQVKHPAVVDFQQMFETPERIFVVMEKMKGDMLEMILSSERGRLSERITSYLIHQILIALQYLHSKNIVHCDLKPENILLASDSDFPQVKLCDFGFARIIGERTFRRSVVGTPAYLAPEVLRNKGFNRSLDMWSVGVIVYVSLSGTFPFNEDEDINDQIQNAAFMYPPAPWSEISAIAIEFINNLLQVKINRRLTVSKALAHEWLQNYQLWCDLRRLEREVGERYVTHESDDARWQDYERQKGITPDY